MGERGRRVRVVKRVVRSGPNRASTRTNRGAKSEIQGKITWGRRYKRGFINHIHHMPRHGRPQYSHLRLHTLYHRTPIMDAFGLPMSFGKQSNQSEAPDQDQSVKEQPQRGESSGRGSRGIVGGGKRKRGRGPTAHQDAGWPDRSGFDDSNKVYDVHLTLTGAKGSG